MFRQSLSQLSVTIVGLLWLSYADLCDRWYRQALLCLCECDMSCVTLWIRLRGHHCEQSSPR